MKNIIYVESHNYVAANDYSVVFKNVVDKTTKRIPYDSIDFIVFDNPKTYFSTRLILKVVEHNIGIILCDEKHSPIVDIYSPFGRSTKLKRLQSQMAYLQRNKNRLWKKIVVQKIQNQSDFLRYIIKDESSADYLKNLIDNISYGDLTNREALAARNYFKNVFGSDFKRGRYDDVINSSLNYGYSIIRSAIKKELAIHGFEQSYGLHHKSSENPYNLVDDLLEPFRPFIDSYTYEFVYQRNTGTFTKEIKQKLINILFEKCVINGKVMSIGDSIRLTVECLVECFEQNTSSKFYLPRFKKLGV